MLTQHKGKMWITKEQAKQKDKSVQNHGDKRQFTLLPATTAAGGVLKHQIVMEGSTDQTFPSKVPGLSHKQTLRAKNTKDNESACFVPVVKPARGPAR